MSLFGGLNMVDVIDKIDKSLGLIQEMGFKKYPKGWTQKSVVKFARTLGKETGLGPRDKGFFDACVAKMSKHFGEGAKGFCAAVKDSSWDTTMWRGKGKSKSKIYRQKKKEKEKEQANMSESVSKEIKIGDKVKYSVKWLKSTGNYTGILPHATGIVMSRDKVSVGMILATVDWGKYKEEVPERVNVRNLVLVGKPELD